MTGEASSHGVGGGSKDLETSRDLSPPTNAHRAEGGVHTLGPWVSFDREHVSNIYSVGNDGAMLAQVHSYTKETGPLRPNREARHANARLIAEAPSLLKALQDLEPFLDAIVCYASSMDEHEPNRLAFNARIILNRISGLGEANGSPLPKSTRATTGGAG